MKRISAFLRPLGALLLALLLFQGCNALNPLCGSARPAPIIASLSASTTTFAEVQQGFLLTVNGSVAGHDHDRLDLRSWNSKRDGQDSERELERSRLHKRWNQPRSRLNYHLSKSIGEIGDRFAGRADSLRLIFETKCYPSKMPTWRVLRIRAVASNVHCSRDRRDT